MIEEEMLVRHAVSVCLITTTKYSQTITTYKNAGSQLDIFVHCCIYQNIWIDHL